MKFKKFIERTLLLLGGVAISFWFIIVGVFVLEQIGQDLNQIVRLSFALGTACLSIFTMSYLLTELGIFNTKEKEENK